MTDDDLLAFGLCGGKKYTKQKAVDADNTSDLDWITSEMWSDIYYLQSLKPFNKKALAEHITQNPAKWDKINYVDFIAFNELPNNKLLDLQQFRVVELHECMTKNDPMRQSRE